MVHEFRLALRMLRRSPGFSVLAILCLTLGIGATTSVFSWIEGILLRPFPLVRNQERLVAITGLDRGVRTDVSWPDFQDLKKNSTLVEAFIGDRIFGTTLNIGDHAEVATGSVVTANYFDALGVHPILGRGFEPEEEVGQNAHPVTVIAYQTWQERYRGDPNIIGRTQTLNGVNHTIIGVAPKGFYGTFVGYSFQFWVPASMEALFTGGDYKLENRGADWIEGFARLKPGVTIEQAQAEISAIAKRLEHDYPATNRARDFKLYPLWAVPFNNAGTLLPTLRISLVVAAFVLLIACANVGNLLLVRSFARRQEMAVRLSVGAGFRRLLKQLFTEQLVLSCVAVAGGFLLAYWCRNVIVLLRPAAPGISVLLPAEIDWRVMALSAAVCVGSAFLLGLIPAIQVSRVDLAGALRAESGGVVGGRGKKYVRSGLILMQVGLSFVLLAATGLLARSVQEIRNSSPGFATQNLLTTYIDFADAGYDAPRAMNFEDELADRLQEVAGVQSIAFSRIRPFTYQSYSSAKIAVEGFEAAPDEQPSVDYNEVSPGYLATIGIPLVSGREFTRADNETGQPVAIVDETMAAQFWRGQDPVGKRVQVQGRWLQVVGVAKASKYRTLVEAAKPFFYVPLRQTKRGGMVFVRTALAPDVAGKILAREMSKLDPSLLPNEMLRMREQVDRMTWTQRAALKLLAVFGALALGLAAVGLYGVMSYSVSQSARELGLRMALGARAVDVLRMVISNGLLLMAAGLILGAGAALLLTRLLGDLLYKTGPRDPMAFAAASAVIALVSLAACFVPAYRASRTDPAAVLRN
jgi:putative ABC transport system permease protein